MKQVPASCSHRELTIRYKIRELFGVDLRSLAAFRIGVGLLLLLDLANRLPDLVAHYTDVGILPRAVAIEHFGYPWFASLHMLSGAAWLQGTLFLLAGVVAVALTVGYRTRTAAVLAWFLLASLHTRNPIVLNGGDALLRVMLFWAMFLPMGACASIDRRTLMRLNRPQLRTDQPVLSAASIALLVQICFVYWFAVLLKTGPSWTDSHLALYYALNVDQLATPAAQTLLGYPRLMESLTALTLLLERYGPMLAFVPVFTRFFRTATVLLFVGFHLLGLAVLLKLGLFPWICAVAWLVFLPGSFWDRLSKLRRTHSSPTAPVSALASEAHAPFTGSAPPARWLARAAHVFVMLSLIYVATWNVRALTAKPSDRWWPASFETFGLLLRLDQRWVMFAPSPRVVDGWYVFPATLADGTRVDMFNDGQPARWSKPDNVAAMYSSQRWRKYLMKLAYPKFHEHWRHYARYLCHSWNAQHASSKHIETLDIYFMHESTPEPGGTSTLVSRRFLTHECANVSTQTTTPAARK